MDKFEVRSSTVFSHNYYISDGHYTYMHRDGEVVRCAREYWPTREQAQAVLDKYQPPHEWVDGDVGVKTNGETIILAHCTHSSEQHYIVIVGGDTGSYEYWDNCVDSLRTTFLFNIKDKLPY